ncbi:MAG: DUF5011 domain-containing protein [Bacteroidia bacterium]|nr:DUF5011 domain-containing protein [Bacteroidia bacterium]
MVTTLRLPYFLVLILSLSLLSCRKDDKTPPVITLNGATSVSLIIGDSYTDPGATAQDDRDGDLTRKIDVSGGVDPDQAGSYVITYSVSDFSGNKSTLERSISVKNTMDAYRGSYLVHDSVWGGPLTDYPETILVSTTVNDRIILNHFGNLANAAIYIDYYTVGDQFNVPSQTLVCGTPPLSRTFSTPVPGTLIGTNPIRFRMNYQIVEGMNTLNGTATYTKQ